MEPNQDRLDTVTGRRAAAELERYRAAAFREGANLIQRLKLPGLKITVRSCRYFGPEVAAARRSVRPVPDRACGSASVRANRVAMRFPCPTPFPTLAITPLRSASIAIWQALRTAPYRHDRTVTFEVTRSSFDDLKPSRFRLTSRWNRDLGSGSCLIGKGSPMIAQTGCSCPHSVGNALVQTHTSEASPQTDEACVAYFDGDTPPVPGRPSSASITKYSASGKAINLLHETWLK